MKTGISEPSPAGTSALLQGLTITTKKNISALENARQGKTVDIAQRVRDISAQLEKTTDIKDKVQRNDAQRILTSQLADLRRDDEKETTDLAEVVLSLGVMATDLGNGLEKLMRPSEEEEGLVRAAEARIKTAEASLVEAQGKMSFLGIKKKAVAAATSELEAAKANLPEVQKAVAKMARQRLQRADMEQSMQVFMGMTDSITELMTSRNSETQAQLKIVRDRLGEAQKIKKEATEALEQLSAEVAGIEIDLRTEEDRLTEMTNGTTEYADQEIKISGLKDKLNETTGKRNEAQVVYSSKEEFVVALELHLSATQAIFQNQRIWLAKLKSDAEEREVTWMNRLKTMKAMSDLEVVTAQNDIGTKTDLDTAAYMSTAKNVSEDMRLRMMEGHPDQMRAYDEIRKATAVNDEKIRTRQKAVIEEWKNKYGLDPLAGSFLGPEREAAAADHPETAAA